VVAMEVCVSLMHDVCLTYTELSFVAVHTTFSTFHSKYKDDCENALKLSDITSNYCYLLST
jgi:hypothetical protein